MLACTRPRLSAGNRSLSDANAIRRQPIFAGPRQQLLPPLMACLQTVRELLLAPTHRRERRVIARRQQLPLLAQRAEQRRLHVGQFGQAARRFRFPSCRS